MVPLDDAIDLARWLVLDPPNRLAELARALRGLDSDGYDAAYEIARAALQWAWDERPQEFGKHAEGWLTHRTLRMRLLALGAVPTVHPEVAPVARAHLEAALEDRNRDVRRLAIDRVAQHVDGELERVRGWATDPDLEVRRRITQHLGQIGPDGFASGRDIFEALARDPGNAEVAWALAGALWDLYDRESRAAFDVARLLSTHDTPEVRWAAVGGFFEPVFADHLDGLLPTLRAWLRSDDAHSYWTIARSLRFVRLTPRALNVLRILFDDPTGDARPFVIDLLADRFDARQETSRASVDLLLRAKTSEDPELVARIAAAEARYELDFSELPPLEELSWSDDAGDEEDEGDEDDDA